MTDLRDTAETKVIEVETKAKGWFARNRYPFLVGAAAGAFIAWVILKII